MDEPDEAASFDTRESSDTRQSRWGHLSPRLSLSGVVNVYLELYINSFTPKAAVVARGRKGREKPPWRSSGRPNAVVLEPKETTRASAKKGGREKMT